MRVDKQPKIDMTGLNFDMGTTYEFDFFRGGDYNGSILSISGYNKDSETGEEVYAGSLNIPPQFMNTPDNRGCISGIIRYILGVEGLPQDITESILFSFNEWNSPDTTSQDFYDDKDYIRTEVESWGRFAESVEETMEAYFQDDSIDS